MNVKLRSIWHWCHFIAVFAILLIPNSSWAKKIQQSEIYQAASDKWAPGILEMRVFDVGKGDATLLHLPDGRFVMIDTGYAQTAPRIISKMKALGVKKIHLLILTHHHKDHAGGFPYLVNAFRIDKVVQSYDQREPCNILLKPGTRLIRASGATLPTLGPTHTHKDENDNSLVIRLEFGQVAVLFAADAIKESIADLLKDQKNLQANVLKVPHHGYFKGFPPRRFFAAVKPEYAIITSDEKAGHPPEGSVIRILKEFGVRVLLTDELGDIQFLSDGKTIDFIPGGN